MRASYFLAWLAVLSGCSDDPAAHDFAALHDGAIAGDAQLAPGDGSSLGDANALTDLAASDGAPVCPCFFGPGQYCGSDAQSYLATHACRISLLPAHTGDILSCSGANSAPGSWSVRATCSGGCNSLTQCKSAKLWVAVDPMSTAACAWPVMDYWSCILNHSTFNQLAATYPLGRQLSWGGGYVLSSACSYSTASGSDRANDDATLQCIARQTGWSLDPGDVVLYVPNFSGCGLPVSGLGGRNSPADLLDGSHLNLAVTFCQNSCANQEGLGFHEVFEAATHVQSADCCNGQLGCAVSPPGGFYTLSPASCGATQVTAQELAPFGSEYDAASCAVLMFQ